MSAVVLSRSHTSIVVPCETPEESRRKAIAYVERLIARYEKELLETPADSDRHVARRAVRELLIADWCQTLRMMTKGDR